jgi:hypothetical protein
MQWAALAILLTVGILGVIIPWHPYLVMISSIILTIGIAFMFMCFYHAYLHRKTH